MLMKYTTLEIYTLTRFYLFDKYLDLYISISRSTHFKLLCGKCGWTKGWSTSISRSRRKYLKVSN